VHKFDTSLTHLQAAARADVAERLDTKEVCKPAVPKHPPAQNSKNFGWCCLFFELVLQPGAGSGRSPELPAFRERLDCLLQRRSQILLRTLRHLDGSRSCFNPIVLPSTL
jgi:hypothetical protein